MSRKDEDAIIIEAERPQQCDFCGEIKELRPYGPNEECICFQCAMKDEETTNKMCDKILFGIDPVKEQP